HRQLPLGRALRRAGREQRLPLPDRGPPEAGPLRGRVARLLRREHAGERYRRDRLRRRLEPDVRRRVRGGALRIPRATERRGAPGVGGLAPHARGGLQALTGPRLRTAAPTVRRRSAGSRAARSAEPVLPSAGPGELAPLARLLRLLEPVGDRAGALVIRPVRGEKRLVTELEQGLGLVQTPLLQQQGAQAR